MRESAEQLRAQSWVYEDVAPELSQVTTVVDRDGAAADSFHTTASRLPGVFLMTADAHRRAAGALDLYAEVVEVARTQVAQALDLWDEGQEQTRRATVEWDRSQTRADVLTERSRMPRTFVDPGASTRAEAVVIATAAHQRVQEAAQVVATQVRAAREDIDDATSLWDRIGGGWSDFWHGATDVGAGVINGIMSFGNALIQNPDILGEIMAGLALIEGGMALEGGGLVLDGTGLGAIAGVPANIAGAAAIAAGAGLVVQGFGRAATEAAGESAVAPLQGVGRGGSGNVAALDAAQIEARAKAATRPGRNSGVRVVDDEDELRALFDELSVGGVDKTPTTGAYANGGKLVELPDGTRVGLRPTSSDGRPTIDIKYPDDRRMKVHIE